MMHIKTKASSYGGVNILEAALLIIIIALPLWPSYLNVKMAGLPNISPTRLLIFIGLLLWGFALLIKASYRKHFINFLKEYSNLIWYIIVPFFGWKLVTAGIAPNRTVSIFSALNDTIYCLGLFLMAANIWRTHYQLKLVIRSLLIVSVIIFFITAVEVISQQNLFIDFVPDAFISAQRLREGLIRDSTYRAWGTFSHPIALAGYCTTVLPLALWYAYSHHGNHRLIGMLVGVFLTITLFLSSSRAGLVVLIFMGVGTIVTKLFPLWISRGTIKDRLFKTVTSLVLTMLICFAGMTVVKKLATGRSIVEAGSSSIRLLQIELGLPLIKSKPLTGYGPNMAATVLGLRANTVDNYYLSLALESGLPEVVLFIVIYCYFLKFAWKLQKRASKAYSGLVVALFWVILGNALFLSVVSLEQTIPFVFLLFSMLTSLNSIDRRNRRVSQACHERAELFCAN